MIAIEVAPGPLRAISVLPDGVMFTREGKLARKATGYESEKAEAALSHIGFADSANDRDASGRQSDAA